MNDNVTFVATHFENITHFEKKIKVRLILDQLNALWKKIKLR